MSISFRGDIVLFGFCLSRLKSIQYSYFGFLNRFAHVLIVNTYTSRHSLDQSQVHCSGGDHICIYPDWHICLSTSVRKSHLTYRYTLQLHPPITTLRARQRATLDANAGGDSNPLHFSHPNKAELTTRNPPTTTLERLSLVSPLSNIFYSRFPSGHQLGGEVRLGCDRLCHFQTKLRFNSPLSMTLFLRATMYN